jgi:nickel/cobalt transporter (NiCoT) family protein
MRLLPCAPALSPAERGRLAGMTAVILALNGAGWGVFVLSVLPHDFRYEKLGAGLGVAVTAWTLGLRHAFDADHISAIDNVTRKLRSDGQRALGAGFAFALGHSTIVVAVGGGIALAARAVFGAVVDPGSAYETLGGVVGTLLAAGFLYLIAALNLVVLSGITRIFRDIRRGRYSEAELERQLQARGLMYRFFGRLMRSINHSWQMFFVGMVFGIGFDTATEVVLLTATVYAATSGLPFYAVLAMPLLFAGGLTLFDTLDGCFMSVAYGWAFARPVRKVYYNLVITGLSVAAAFLIGTVEIAGLLTTELRLRGPFWDFVAGFDINTAGFTIAGLFIVVWASALAVWRWGNLDSRWPAAGPAGPPE